MNIFEKVDRCHEAIRAIRPFEGHMLEQLKDYYRIVSPGRAMPSRVIP